MIASSLVLSDGSAIRMTAKICVGEGNGFLRPTPAKVKGGTMKQRQHGN